MGPTVSEYQRYEFVALERPLTARQIAELRAVSTRAEALNLRPHEAVGGSYRGCAGAIPGVGYRDFGAN